MRKCHDCGHEHPTMASASRGTTSDEITSYSTRYFCHDNDHSCYESRYGNYWDDPRMISKELALEIVRKALEERL